MLNGLHLLALLSLCSFHMSLGQRPSFAGSRPPGGLNQKDKYHGTMNTAAENSTGVDIANRFGAPQQQPETVTLAFGASQRPPTGVVLVTPAGSYVPLVAPVAVAAPAGVVNRFGDASASASPTPGSTAAAPASPPSSVPVSVPATSINALPIDAYGDQDYVNHLNRLPLDQQPFWFINYQAIEAQRNSSRPNQVLALETRGSFFGG